MKAIRLFVCLMVMTTAMTGATAQSVTKGETEEQLPILFSGKPTPAMMQRDLIGHKLTEGFENGYHEEGWTWTIKRGDISHFRIVKVLEQSNTKYTVVAKMNINEEYFTYDTTCKISYRKSATGRNAKKWKFDYVNSMGMKVVASHEYDNCIRAAVIDDGWGGTYCLKLTNSSEMRLVVAGDFLTDGTWRRFAVPVEGFSSMTVGGLFNGGSVSKYRISFIVRSDY